MKKPQVPIALEGYPFIACAAFATFIFAILGYALVAFVGVLLTCFILYFFRDPERIAPDEDDAVVSPADGRILSVEKVFDERYVKEHVYKISIFMNVFNVHVNRVPYSGRVSRIVYTPGSFYAADSEHAALENECNAIVIKTQQDDKTLAVVQVAGLLARRIVCWVSKNDELRRGERFGLIRFGSRVDLYLPQQMQVEVSAGQKVRAGETVLGYLS
jgi:phosphatidylserine decarboxylase